MAKSLATLEGHTEKVTSVAFAPDGKTLASASWDRTIRLWEVGSNQSLASLEEHRDDVLSVAFAPDGKTLASGGREGAIRLWEVDTGQQKAVLGEYGSGIEHEGAVTSVAFSIDGRTLASGSADKTIRLWEVSTGHYLFTPGTHEEGVTSVAFSMDGKPSPVGIRKARFGCGMNGRRSFLRRPWKDMSMESHRWRFRPMVTRWLVEAVGTKRFDCGR